MLNTVGEILGDKTIAQYKIIEDRYLTLKRYLRLLMKKSIVCADSIEIILTALDDEPIEEIKEVNKDE